MAQDDYYYEIQLTNKQLVFYFMAGAAGLILSFLAGVMVGRGIDVGAGPGSEQSRQIVEDKVISEQTPAPAATAYSYPQLESDRPPEGLETQSSPAGAPSRRPAATPETVLAATPAPARTASPRPAPSPAATPPARAAGLPKPIGTSANTKGFAVQVGAFKDRASADTVIKSLKSRGLPAFAVVPAGGGLLTVRVGVYRDRADAEAVKERLREDKFNPYIIKQ